MENLAGVRDCDEKIESELMRCGINISRGHPHEGEVPTSLRGILGLFVFYRAWYYWVVRGDVPIAVAQELYNDPVGKMDIRVNGDCGCPAPERAQITWKTRDGRRVLSANEEVGLRRFVESGVLPATTLLDYAFSDDPASIGAQAFIPSYHIDTEIGLRVFVDTLKKHNLA